MLNGSLSRRMGGELENFKERNQDSNFQEAQST